MFHLAIKKENKVKYTAMSSLKAFQSLPVPTGFRLKHYMNTSYLQNRISAAFIMDRLKLNKFYKNDVKVLDTYSNNLVFSTTLYNHLQPSQYVLMESRKLYLKHIYQYMDSIQDIKHNLQFVQLDPYNWASYIQLTEQDKILTPEFQTRDHLHTNFLFTGAVFDEGLIIQWLSCLVHQNWIMKYGNVKMLLWIPETTAIKLTAPPGFMARARCSILAQTPADVRLVAVQSDGKPGKFSSDVLSRDDPLLIPTADFTSATKICLVELNPKDVAIDNIYSWDYVVKNLMISKKTKLKESVKNLGPGAIEYFASALDKDSLEKQVKSLECSEFLEITKAFDAWPFKPESLFSFVSNDVN